jgi:hypothetical protein
VGEPLDVDPDRDADIRGPRSPPRHARLIKSTPQKMLADGTDWRLLNELKKERKG